MKAFKIYLNQELSCVAGLEGLGSVGSSISWMRRENDKQDIINLTVVGIEGNLPEAKSIIWLNKDLKVGDEIVLKITEVNPEEITPAITQSLADMNLSCGIPNKGKD